MGQIVSSAAKPKRCNLNQLSQVPTPAAGEHILVSSDNSMNAAGQGNFDCYIVGNGRDAATALPLIKTYANDVDDEPTAGSDKLVKSGGVYEEVNQLNQKVFGNSITSYDQSILTFFGYIRQDGTATAESVTTFKRSDYIPVKHGDTVKVVATFGSSTPSLFSAYSDDDESSFVESVIPSSSGYDKEYDYVVPTGVNYLRFSGHVQYLNRTYSIEIVSADKSLVEKIDEIEVHLDDKQNILQSGSNIKTINGESILGSGDLKVGNGLFKYLFVQDGIIVAVASGNRFLTIKLGPGGGNGLFDFREFGQISAEQDFTEANIQRLHYSSSDWIAPFQIRAIDNIDGDDTENITFTGGAHQYNNSITGSTPTARLASVEYRIDGELVTEGNGQASFLKIVVTEYIQATNTKKQDGTGREVLQEIVTWQFDGVRWSMETELVPLEDISLVRWYGYQFTGIGSGLVEHWGYINGTNRGLDATTSGNDSTIGMYANGNVFLKMLVDVLTDMGNRAFMTDGATDSAFKSGSKGYFYIANNNAILAAGNHYFLNGSYEFSLPKEETPLISGSFNVTGSTVNSSFSIAELEDGNYYVIYTESGTEPAGSVNITRTERDKSGAISPWYNYIVPGQKCYFEKTSISNYLWFYKGGFGSELESTMYYKVFRG